MIREDDNLYPRRLQIKSGSLCLVIPPQIYKALGWAQGNWVTVHREGNRVILSHLVLGQSSPEGELHKLVPKGKHGKRFREENAAKDSNNGASSGGTSKPG